MKEPLTIPEPSFIVCHKCKKAMLIDRAFGVYTSPQYEGTFTSCDCYSTDSKKE